MGKKQKIRNSAGDLVKTPGPLHKQIEKANLAITKFKLNTKQFHKQNKGTKFVDPTLSSKILLEAKKQFENEIEGLSDQDDFSTVHEDYDLEEEMIKQLKELDAHDNEIKHEEAIHNREYLKIKQKAESKKDINYHDLDPAVVTLYTEIAQILSKYRSGKIPKAFKVIPSLLNWEQILELTCPDKWTSAIMLHATKMFSTSGTPAQCQRFYNLILLPRIRDEIYEYQKLHFHMYQCLFKAMYKPAAFFKGILLPLCRVGTCTIREAVILGSVLKKVSIPQMHAAAAMLSIAKMDFSPSNSYILRVLIEKNYTLPFRALDALVFYFLRKLNDSVLPVAWHQCLLAFVERYAKDINSKQRETLILFTKEKPHHQITPEIHKILRNSNTRNVECLADAHQTCEMEL